MRRLNVRFFLILVAGLSLLLGGVYVLHRVQTRRNAGALLRQADQAEAKGDRVKVIQYLGTYLAYKPEDLETLARYGELLASDNPISAIATLEKVVTRDPDRSKVRRRVAELSLDTGEQLIALAQSPITPQERVEDYVGRARESFSTALAHLDVLDPQNQATPLDGKNAALQTLRGKCHEGLGNFVEAAKAYETARTQAPDQVEACWRLAYLLRQREFDDSKKLLDFDTQSQLARIKKANEVMDDLVKKNDQSAAAYLARCRYRAGFGQPGAAEDAAHARQLAPDNGDTILIAAKLALQKRQTGLDEARRLLEDGLKLDPKNASMYELRGRIEIAVGKLDEAIACFRNGVKALPENSTLIWLLADSLITAGGSKELEEAATVIDRFEKVLFNPLIRDYLKARLMATQRRWREAADELERVALRLASRPATAETAKQAYNLLGRCLAILNKPDRRLAAIQHAVEIQTPGNPRLDLEARAELAAAYADGNKFDEAIAEYRKMLVLPDAPLAIRTALARALLNRELRAPERQRRWEEVDQALVDAENNAEPRNADIALLRAEVFTQQGRLDDAIAKVKEALVRSPDSPNLRVALANLERRRGRPDEALRLLDETEKRLGPRIELRLARVSDWVARGGSEAVAALAELERTAAELKGDERKALLTALYGGYTLLGDVARARSLGQTLARENPSDLDLRLSLFEQALQDGNESEADTLAGEIRKIETDTGTTPGADRSEGPVTLYSLAMLAIQKGSEERRNEARLRLLKAAQLRPGWSRVPLALALLAERDQKHDLDLALKNYQEAIDLGERSPLVIIRAAELCTERGRYGQAEQFLQKLQGLALLPGPQHRAENVRDLAQAREAVAIAGNDSGNHLKLGRVLSRLGQEAKADGQTAEATKRLKEAENEYIQARKRPRDKPDADIAFVQFLVSEGRTNEAKDLAKEMEQAFPKERHALSLAQCYSLLGDSEKANALCREAVDRAANDPATLLSAADIALRSGQTAAGESYLDRLIKLGDKAPKEAAIARKALALVKASGGPRKVNEALQALATSGTATPNVDDRRTKATILARYPIRENWRQAIAILEELVKEGQALPDDQVRLYGLYELDGDWPKARDLIQKLLAADALNPVYPALFANSLIRHGQPGEAQPWVKRLEMLAPGSPVAMETKARMLAAQGQKAEAARLLETFVRNDPTQLLTGARMLEQLGIPESAEPLYRRFVKESNDPKAPFVLAGYLARRGRLKDAIDLCELAWPKNPPAAASNTCVTVLSQALPADDASCQRVRTWIEDAMRKHPEDLSLPFSRAYLLGLQGKLAEAEQTYREIITKAPDNSAVFNNLAWLLAIQKGRGAEAFDLIGRAIKIAGENPDLRDTRALAHLAQGQYGSAIKDLEDAVVEAPAADKYFHLAQAYLGAGKTDNARQALRKARELGLKAEGLHPLERVGYNQLVASLPEP